MKVNVTESVQRSIRTLSSQDRQKIFAWIDHLGNWENDSTVRKNSKHVGDKGNLYVLRATNDVRVFFLLQGDTITVVDVATKDSIITSGKISG